MIRNYNCLIDFGSDPKNHEILNKCSRKTKNILLKHVIGEGSSGIVYLASAYINGTKKKRKVCIKKIELEKKNMFEEKLYDLFSEVEYSILMGEIGIGPIIFDAFFIETPLKLTQFIFMECGEGDVHDYLLNSVHSNKAKQNIIKQMIKLIKIKISNNIYCNDIKPGNFIYTRKNNKIVVKMIDFEVIYCNTNMSDFTKKNFLLIILIQLFYLVNEILKQKYSNDELYYILIPFFKEPLFKKILQDPYVFEDLITEIMENSIGTDIYNVFMHYIDELDPYNASIKTITDVHMNRKKLKN